MIIVPSSGGHDFVTEPTPPFIWDFANQDAFRLKITLASDRTTILHDSKVQKTDVHSYTPPAGVITRPGARYSVILSTQDKQADRVVGDQWVTTIRDFTFSLSSDTSPVSSFTVEQPDRSPLIRFTATRGTAPDSFSLEVDGDIAVADIDPAALLVSPGEYRYDYFGAVADSTHDYRLVPVENGKAASGGLSLPVTCRYSGVWLCDPGTAARFCLLDADLNLSYGEDAEVTPKAGQDFTRKISSMRGLEGEVSGILVAENDFDSRTLTDQLTDVYTIKARQPSRTFRFAAADMNVPVVVGNLSPNPSTQYRRNIPQRTVSYWIGQRGELPYTVVL